LSQDVLSRAERELDFADKHGMRILDYLNSDYPRRLQHCYDSPMVLYCSGYTDLNVAKIIGVVGTRNVTDYGKLMTDKVISDLVADEVLVVSGLAYGVDTCAHYASVKYGLKTAAVLAHGLHTIYPPVNRNLARKILDEGGCLLTEQISGTEPDRENFPKRNRIVAGMIDCLIVVESAAKGGALITAEIANTYDREVFAFPGKIGDVYSEGCNKLIKENKANIMTDVEDLRYIMRWNEDKKVAAKQMRMFRDFSEDEQKVMDMFGNDNVIYLDKIITETTLSPTKIASILLSLEFDGVLTALPGKRYQKL
jgi:DNA processing protein